METKALQLASRFALPPNSLGYCGKDSAPEKFKKCFISGDCEGVEEEIRKFIVLYPYLKTISDISNLPSFAHEVVEAYCIGNDTLKKAKQGHYKILLDNLTRQGVPGWLVKDLSQNKPEAFIPHHLFQVLHIGVGRASGAVPFNLQSINNCMIRWGKVEKIENGFVLTTLNSLEKTNGKYNLVEIQEKPGINLKFVPGIKEGDTVAVHWQQIIKILTKKEEENLSYWTKEVLKAVN